MVGQENKISGVVTSKSDGMPLPGVGVIIKGTSKGVETDFDGEYQIKASKGDIISFTYIGMKTQSVSVSDQTTLNITLEDANLLDEVVVTALGIKKEKKALGYAVTNVKSEDLQMGKDPNVVNSLQGKVAGIDINQASAGVGSANRVVIRGNNSITGNNQALYVVDGVPIDNSENEGGVNEWGDGVSIGNGVADINPDDIESVSVLKGANAAALYGARASNGVIMITTKKGKEGKMSVGFNSSVTVEEVAFTPDFQNVYGQGNDGVIPNKLSDLVNNGSWGPKMDGSTQLLWTGNRGVYESNPNNVRNFFSTGTTINNSIYVEGGTEKITSRVSYTRNDVQGIVPNNELRKNVFSVYTKLNLGKLQVDLKGNYINQQVKNRPYLSVWPDNVVYSLYTLPRNVKLSDLEQNQSLRPLHNGSINNPYHSVNKVGTEDSRNRVFGFAKANYQFTDNFSAMLRAGTDYATQEFLAFYPKGHVSKGNGELSDLVYTNQETNLDFLLTYQKELSEDFAFTITGGGNSLEQKRTVRGGKTTSIIADGIHNILNSDNYVRDSRTGLYRKRVNSLYSTLDLDYKGYLFAQITARNDWSSVLPLHNNSFFYPSVSLSGILSDMFDFSSEMINYLKVRGSWAQVGSDGQIDPYTIHYRYLTETPYLGNSVLNSPNVKPNPDLVPQTTTSLEFGLEAKMFKNRFGIDLSLYNTSTKDQVIQLPAPSESGFDYFLLNQGTLTNRGVELGLDFGVIKKENLKWNVGVNFARNITEVSDLSSDNIPLADIKGGTAFRILAQNNGNYGDIVGYGYKRNEKGQIMVNNEGIPLRSDEQQVFGNFNPDWTGGITSNLSYKNISFSFLISSKVGGQILSRTDMILDVNGNSKRTLAGREGGILVPNSVVSSTGASNQVPANAQAYYRSIGANSIIEDYVFDADYVKLKEVSIGYSLPKKLLSGTNISDASIRLIGRNLFFFHRETDSFDPEISGFNTRNAQGVELLSLPGTRSYGVNLSVKF